MKTIVGLYRTVEEANQVKQQLTSQGFSGSDITVLDQTQESYDPATTSTGYNTTDADHNTVGGRIRHFFSSLSGSDDAAHDSYTQGVNGGGAMVAVKTDDSRADEVADLLQRSGASDIDGAYESAGYGGGYAAPQGNTLGADAGDLDFGTGTGTLAGADSTLGSNRSGVNDLTQRERNDDAAYLESERNLRGEQVIPVVEENLQVGKRQVQRGGVRIYAHVVETPVSESVNLHDERIVVDRRPVDRPATDADFNTNPGVIEVNATGEEAVVGKRSRVVEEIRVGKEETDRTEQINDTVRHTEVDVEPVGGETRTVGVGGQTTGSTTRRS